MKPRRPFRFLKLALLISAVVRPGVAVACATCYGASDAAMARGMNAGIFALLGVVGFVLGGFGGFMIFLARRAASSGG